MVLLCGEKDRGRCSNENMEVIGHQNIGRPKLSWSNVIRKGIHDSEEIQR